MAKTAAKANFKKTTEDFHTLQSQIKSGKYAPVYLFMGEESYFIDAATNLISNSILSPEEREFNLTIIYGKDTNGAQICEAARTYPMMGAYNIVIVKEAQQTTSFEDVTHYFGKADMIPRTTILVLCYKGKSMDKRSVLYKRIAEYGVILESINPRDYEISPWIEQMIRSRGVRIDANSIEMLVANLGTDLSRIDKEIDKLLTSLPQGVKEITSSDIEANIGISKDFNPFELTRALSSRDGYKAMLIADNFIQSRNDANIFASFTLIFTHFQRIFTLGMMLWDAKRKGQPSPSDADIMRQLKLSSPIFVKEYHMALRNYDTSKAFTALGLIRQYDMKMKGVDAGVASTGDIFNELIIKLLAL